MSDLAFVRPMVARNGIMGVDATRFEVLVGLGRREYEMGRSREGRLQLGSIGLVVHVFNILIFRRASERVRAREYIRTGNIEW